MEFFDISLLNWLEKYAGECKYFKLATKCLRYEGVKIKDILIEIFQSLLIDQAHITEEFLKKIMETDSIEKITQLTKPNVNELYLEMIANMTIFKEYTLETKNSWEEEKYDPYILNKIKDNHKNNKWIQGIITEALEENEIKDNICLMKDFCNRYEEELEKCQNMVIKEEKRSLEKLDKEYQIEKEKIEKQKNMCLLGIPGHIPELEMKLENIKNDFIKKHKTKRKMICHMAIF